MGAKLMKEAWSWTRMIGIALAISVLVNAFLLQPYEVKGDSMQPSYQDKDYTMVWKATDQYHYNEVVIVDRRITQQRGWSSGFVEHPIVQRVFGLTQDNLIIKRVIGLPGDVLEFRSNVMYRNGNALEEEYIKEAMRGNPDRTVLVPEDHLFVLGDNRNHSSDSRAIGSIPLSHVLGKVIFHK